ncbi:MAG TPA: spore germination protein, partial [Symbiobacteriaceae bacterium]|nr:spore germination protein [Symbiobacteriaceae bacterium]
EFAARGLWSSAGAVLGFLPRFDTTNQAHLAAMLLDTGHVMVLVDRLPTVHVAPVAISTWFASAGDYGTIYPVRRLKLVLRLTAYGAVLLLPGMLVSLMNYHMEMLPTAFLTAIASVRENSPFGIFFEVLWLEVLSEVGWTLSRHASAVISPGTMLNVLSLFFLLAVLAGFSGPAPAVMALTGAIVSLLLPSFDGVHVVRVWRFYLLLGAIILGFYGMAAVFTMMVVYLCTVRRWGVPFLSASGPKFTAPEGTAVRPPRQKGGRPIGKNPPGLR